MEYAQEIWLISLNQDRMLVILIGTVISSIYEQMLFEGAKPSLVIVKSVLQIIQCLGKTEICSYW